MGDPTVPAEPSDADAVDMTAFEPGSASGTRAAGANASSAEASPEREGARSPDPALPNEDLERAHRIGAPVARFMNRWHAWIRRYPWLNAVYRVLVTLLGVAVMLIGIVLIPLPGPGWLIVFIGLTILGSEFHWARRLTTWTRMQLARFWERWRGFRAHRRQMREARSARRSAQQAAGSEHIGSRRVVRD